MYAFLNATAEVVAVSTTARTLVEVQGVLPEATERIDGAPVGLVPRDSVTATNTKYHTKVSGDGTQLADYAEAENLVVLKTSLMTRIDEKASNTIEGGPGFEWPAASGKFFSLSSRSQTKWNMLYNARASIGYPYRVLTQDNTDYHDIVNAVKMADVFVALAGVVVAELTLAMTAKENTMAAATEAATRAAADVYLNA